MTNDKKQHCIVTVSDTKLSTGSYSGEMTTLKLRHLSDNWKCLVSGTFAHHVPLTERIIAGLGDSKETYEEMVKICTQAFIAENRRLAEETVLSPYGLCMEEFLKSRDNLGDSLFERLWGEIARVKVECQLLVCGFGESRPHIFVAENPEGNKSGFITNCDFPGFAAIGSGSYLAESTLYSVFQHSVRSMTETIYTTSLAKFNAESASDVGRETFLKVMVPEGEIEIDNNFTVVSELRAYWERRGKLKIPSKALALINKHLR